MIIKTQYASYASLTHDNVTYRAKELGALGNTIQITFNGSDEIDGVTLSNEGRVISVNYETAPETITTPATYNEGVIQGINFKYLLAGESPKPILVELRHQGTGTANEVVYDSSYFHDGEDHIAFIITLIGLVSDFTQSDIVSAVQNADSEITALLEATATTSTASLSGIGPLILSGGADAVTASAITLQDYNNYDVLGAYLIASNSVKALIEISVDAETDYLQTPIALNLIDGQDDGENILARGVYAGMTESELIELREKLRKALTDNTTGNQVISVSIAGKQVTKQLPSYAEIRQELIELNLALAKINPSKYGKPRRRFTLDHRNR